MSLNPPSEQDPLLEMLWDRGLILFGDRVREEYALNTPIFIDLRRKLHEDLEALQTIGAALHRRISENVSAGTPQQVIGIPDTATPLALAAAFASRMSPTPLAYGQLRKRPADYPGGRSGAQAYMGVPDPGREITLIDDVMASGKTKLWSIEQLREAGLKPSRVLVVVDREQGGDRILEELGVPTLALYRVTELIAYFERTGKISADTAQAARGHIESRRFSQKKADLQGKARELSS